MSQPRSLPGKRSGLLVVALLGLLLGPFLAGVPARAADVAPVTDSPLRVTLVRLTPSALPTRGTVVLVGSVTNESAETWSAVNVHPFISSSPMTTRDELAAAASSDPDTEVGTRLIDQGQFVGVGTLAPAATAPFRIALKVADLRQIITGAPGVYWIGVHALGQSADGGARQTLGRARTFIPLVQGTRQTSVAVVVPVREQVRRDPDGRVLGTTGWSEELGAAGRLGRIAAFAASAGVHPATLLIDPAVLEAVEDLKDDNPAVSFGTAPSGAPSGEPSSSPTGSPSRSGDRLEPADRATAKAWLDQVVAAAKDHTTLGLGYADPDAASLARRRPVMLTLAAKLAAQTFAGYDIPAVPTIAPSDGWFDDDLLPRIAPETTVLVSDHAAPRNRTQWRTAEHQDLVFSDAQSASGGPGPTVATDALALRQRIISDAALRLSEGTGSPMVVKLPDDWDPGYGWQLADFFNALAQPWLNLVSLTPTSDVTTPTFDASLGYPASVRRTEIPRANLSTAGTLIHTATITAHLLRSKNSVAHDLAGTAFDAVSLHARNDQLQARQQVIATNDRIRGTLGKVQVIGTDFVTLSGGSGILAVTLVNGLDQPVRVGIEPLNTGRDVRIDKVTPVQMAPGERTVLRLHADASGVGVTQIALSPVTTDGFQIGTPLTFRLRTSPVGKLIWGVLGAGGLLLVVMIVRRVRRGLREHRWRRA